jgi:hypothetical protein
MLKKIAIILSFSLYALTATAGPIVPTRGFLMQPRWDRKTDTTTVFDRAGYWAQVQRGFGSDSDRWGWSATMGAIFEIARWQGNKSLVGFTGTELTADTHSDIDFRPRGIVWTEGIFYAVHETSSFDWQLGAFYNCRHDVDNGDPGQYSDVGGQRTLIYCSLGGKTIFQSEKLFGLPFPTTAWLHADLYTIGEDYRLPKIDSSIGTNFSNLAWSFGESLQTKFAEWGRNSVYFMLNTDFTAFSHNNSGFFQKFVSVAQTTFDDHIELGYEFHGREGRIQMYAGWEQWQDDGQTPIPRDANYALLGIRVTGADLVTF